MQDNTRMYRKCKNPYYFVLCITVCFLRAIWLSNPIMKVKIVISVAMLRFKSIYGTGDLFMLFYQQLILRIL